MAGRKVAALCKTSEEVLVSDMLLDIAERVLESMDIYNTGYVISILNKIRAREDLILDEYKDLLFVLDDKRFLEKVDAFYDKIDIKGDLRSLTEDLEHLKLEEILKNIRDIAKHGLISNLEVRGKVGSRFTFEKCDYILAGEGRDKISSCISNSLHVEGTKFFSVYFADKKKALLTETGKLVARCDNIKFQKDNFKGNEMLVVDREDNGIIYKGLVTKNGLEYGGMKWKEISFIKEIDGEEYLFVRSHEDKVGYVDSEGNDIFGGPNWDNILPIDESDDYMCCIVGRKKEQKMGIVSKQGKLCFDGPVWDIFRDLIFEGKGLKYAVFQENGKDGVVGVGGSHVFGGFRWQLVKDVIILPRGKKYAKVVGDNNQTKFVNPKGEDVFGGNLVAEMYNYEFKVDKYNFVYLQAEKDGKKGLIVENGNKVFGGFVWEEIKGFEYIGDQIFLVAKKENKPFVHVDIGGSISQIKKTFK